MKEGSLALIEFTGKELNTGKIFDTTSKEEAEKAGIAKEKGVYRPIPVMVGKGEVIRGMDEALKEMKENEKTVVKIPPEKGFGERRKDLVVVVPLKEFKARKMQPHPGMIVEMNEQRGRVQTVSGGRVRVDFNHDLAGKTLEYEVKIVKELKGKKEKVEALYGKYFPFIEETEGKVELKGNEAEIYIPGKFAESSLKLKPLVARILMDGVKGIEAVKFIEEYANPAKPKEKEK